MVFRGKNIRRFRIVIEGRKIVQVKTLIWKITTGDKQGETVYILINYNGTSGIVRRNSEKDTHTHAFIYIYIYTCFKASDGLGKGSRHTSAVSITLSRD
jgi:hypothetical protein